MDNIPNGLRITSLSLIELISILSKVSNSIITEDMINKDIQDGAPVNPDGTINLIYYVAWLVKERGAHQTFGANQWS